MTTGNKIVTKTVSDVVYIPIECIQVGADSIPFVYLKNGTKQIVVIGETNENNIIIEQGLKENMLIFLNIPEKPENFKLAGEEFISVIREREQAKRDEERRSREEAERARNAPPTTRSRGGGQGVSAETRERIQQAVASGDTTALREMRQNMQQSGDSTVVRFREGAVTREGGAPQQGNQQQSAGARVRQDGNQQPPAQQPVQAPPSSNQ